MNQRLHEQLDKILALADSAHDGEATAAVRKARQMLSQGGLSFGDLARAAVRGKPARFPFFTAPRDHLESQIDHLRQQLDDLQSQMQTQDLQLDFWRRRAADLEQSSTKAFLEAERWKKLARDTAERLWDIGHSISDDSGHMSQPAAVQLVKK